MVALSGAVANSSFLDLRLPYGEGIFQPNAVRFVTGEIAARNAEKFARERDERGMGHAIRLQKMEQDFGALQQDKELRAAEKRARIAVGRPTSKADKFALLFQSGALDSLAEAFKPSANLGADLLKQYQVLTQNRPNPFQTAEETLTRTNNFQTLVDGLGSNVLAPYMARGLNEYYDTTANPFSASLPNPTQGFL